MKHANACNGQVRYLTKPTPKGSWVSCACGAVVKWRKDKGVAE